MFSIIMPTYNRAHLISIGIQSVISQTYDDWELLIIDDGSTDNTKEIIKTFKDPRIKYLYQNNTERSAARNNGIDKALGEWICFLDSDDYYDIDYLTEIHKELELKKTDCLLVGYKKSKLENKKIYIINGLNEQPNLIDELIKTFRPIGVCEIICKKTVFNSFKFPEQFNVWEDTHVFYRILSNFKYSSSNVIGYNVVQHAGSGVTSAEFKVDATMVNTYVKAIIDLFENNCNDLMITKNCNSAKVEYLHGKYQMFFYRAIMSKDYKNAKIILKMALKNKKISEDFVYFSKAFVKLFLLKFTPK